MRNSFFVDLLTTCTMNNKGQLPIITTLSFEAKLTDRCGKGDMTFRKAWAEHLFYINLGNDVRHANKVRTQDCETRLLSSQVILRVWWKTLEMKRLGTPRFRYMRKRWIKWVLERLYQKGNNLNQTQFKPGQLPINPSSHSPVIH